MSHIIYIITGETGEYDACVKWVVGAFLDEVSCSNYLNRLNQWLLNNNIPLSCKEYVSLRQWLLNNEEYVSSSGFLDLQLEKYWTGCGVEYHIEELPIFDNI